MRGRRCVHVLAGHAGELSTAQFNFAGDVVMTSSIDSTLMVWRVHDGRRLHVLEGHKEAVMDACFNASGSTIASGSSDHTARLVR
jgi:dynein assembly factor with WDR repeat domains 1